MIDWEVEQRLQTLERGKEDKGTVGCIAIILIFAITPTITYLATHTDFLHWLREGLSR